MTDLGEPGYQRFLDGQVGNVLSIAGSALRIGAADLSTLTVGYDVYSVS